MRGKKKPTGFVLGKVLMQGSAAAALRGGKEEQARGWNCYRCCKITPACDERSKATQSVPTTIGREGQVDKDVGPARPWALGSRSCCGQATRAPQPEAHRLLPQPGLYKQVPFLILFHHNIQVMLMTQQDEKLTSLRTISPACHTPKNIVFIVNTYTFSPSHPPLCFPDFSAPLPALLGYRTQAQPGDRAPPCAGHGVKASSSRNPSPKKTEPTSFDSFSVLEITKSQKTRFQFRRRPLPERNPSVHSCMYREEGRTQA